MIILVVRKSNFYACPQIVAPTQLVYERLHVGLYIYIYIYIYIYYVIYYEFAVYIYCIICVTPCSLFITPSSWGWVPLCFSQLGWLQHADSCRLGSKRKTTPGHRFCPCFVKEKSITMFQHIHSILVYIGIDMLKLFIYAQKKHVHLKRKSSSCPPDIPKLRDFSGSSPHLATLQDRSKGPMRGVKLFHSTQLVLAGFATSLRPSSLLRSLQLVIKGTSPLWPLSYNICLLIYIYVYINIYIYVYIMNILCIYK